MSQLYKKLQSYLYILFFVLLTTFLLWLPFILRAETWLSFEIDQPNFLYVYRHFDGLLYVIAAKTLYSIDAIRTIPLDVLLPDKYFAAHLPLYPLLIRAASAFFTLPKAMIFVNLASSIVLGWLFYFIVTRFKITKNPLILTMVFLMLPRFLIIRSIGAPESLFMLCILGSLYFFERKQLFFSALMGSFAVATKTPAMLLIPAFLLTSIEQWRTTKKINWGLLWYLLIPLSLFGVFCLYAVQMGDFFAYFNSGDNIHLVFPFAAFNFQKLWVGTAWLEDVLFYFFIYTLTIISLRDTKYRSFFYFGLVFLLAVLFVEHRDIARYSLPLWPLFCIRFEKFLTSKPFLLTGLLILPGIYMYAWNFMLYNIMPVTNWKPFF